MQSNSILHSYSWPPTHGSCIKMSDQQTACNDHLQSDWHFTKTQIKKTLFSCLAIPPLPPSTPPSPRRLLNVPWHNFNSIHITHPWYWIGIRANGITDSDSDTVFSKQTETEKWWKGIRQAINTTKQKNGRYRSINVDKHKKVKATNLVLSRRTGGAGGFSPSSDRLLDILPAGQVTVLTSLGPVTHS